MIRTIIVATGFGLCVMPALAQPPEDSQTAFAKVVEEHGCRVTTENNQVILEVAGLAEADAATVVQALIKSGSAVIENGELVLTSDACQ